MPGNRETSRDHNCEPFSKSDRDDDVSRQSSSFFGRDVIRAPRDFPLFRMVIAIF